MACSDTYAEILESRDPEFRARNEYNSAAREVECHSYTTLCAWGAAACDGLPFTVRPLNRMRELVGNSYVDADTATAVEMGTWRKESQVASINRAADAAESLREWAETGSGGALAFSWLIEHWQFDLDRLERDNARHTEELKHMAPNLYKAGKRRSRLAKDVPEAEAVKRRIAWARERLAAA